MINEQDNEAFTQLTLSWQDTLEDLKHENVRLKHLLCYAVSKNVSREFIEDAEHFLQKFLDREQIVALLNRDIYELSEKKDKMVDIKHQFLSIDKDMKKLQDEFKQLRSLFYSYLGIDKL